MIRCATVLLLASLIAAPAAAAEMPPKMTTRLVVKMHPWMVERGILPDPLEAEAKSPGAE